MIPQQLGRKLGTQDCCFILVFALPGPSPLPYGVIDPSAEKKYESERELSPGSNVLELFDGDEISEHLLSYLCQRFFLSAWALGPIAHRIHLGSR